MRNCASSFFVTEQGFMIDSFKQTTANGERETGLFQNTLQCMLAWRPSSAISRFIHSTAARGKEIITTVAGQTHWTRTVPDIRNYLKLTRRSIKISDWCNNDGSFTNQLQAAISTPTNPSSGGAVVDAGTIDTFGTATRCV